MSRVNPKIDLVFKKLFGSEENKDILMSLLNAILPFEQQVSKITLKNPYNVSDYAEGKLSILDIKAEGEDGRLFDVEMQIRGTDFYGRRTLYYWAKMFGSQFDYINDFPTANEQMTETEKLWMLEKQGELGYSGLKKCIVISLMDFNFFDDKKYHRYYTLKDGETNEKHKDLDYLDLYFIELKKYNGKLQNINTTLERWITFLNYAHQFNFKTLPKELAEVKEIQKASQKLDAMYLDEKEKSYYEAQQKFWLDQNAFIKEAVEKAQAEGARNSKFEMAKKAISKGLENEFIAELTGLTIDQIEQIRNETH